MEAVERQYLLRRTDEALLCLRSMVERLSESAAKSRALILAIPSFQPVRSSNISSGFGNRVDPFTGRSAFHSGVDFPLSAGSPVYSAAAGTVALARFSGQYGRLVEVDHGNGLITRYAHLGAIEVRAGQHVQVGQRLGVVGVSGRSTGPHLHFEVLKGGKFVDPSLYLARSRS